MLMTELKTKINNGEIDERLGRIYSPEKLPEQKERYLRICGIFEELYGKGRDVGVFSAPGRTEVGGNHTDHNNGKVLAASINLDAVAVAAKSEGTVVRVKSERYDEDVIDFSDLSIRDNETTHSASLIRGVIAAFVERGYNVGGFDAATSSDVLSGSGLSSSAAFEVLIGTILNYLYNDGKIPPVEIAKISQWAENVYFGKPCGLMDQTACSVGGFVKIDFANPASPVIEKVDFDFGKCSHSLCIIDSGADHSDLTDDYAAVRGEMEGAAAVFGKKVLREVEKEDFLKNISLVREKVNDRAVLRSLHYYGENERVEKLSGALKNNDFEEFKRVIIESGHSSFMYNQNVFTCKTPLKQAVSLALAMCDEILGDKGAYRVHGGGFAGTVQAFVPDSLLPVFKEKMAAVFGEKAIYTLSIRPEGGYCVAL